MAEILLIRRKTPSNQSINQSINQHRVCYEASHEVLNNKIKWIWEEFKEYICKSNMY